MYHPWNETKSLKHVLDTLDADIICFQEMKVARAKMTVEELSPTGYEGYFSFCKTKSGYSGVATYVRSPAWRPVAAEEGITGVLRGVGRFEQTSGDLAESALEEDELDEEVGMVELDSEGRCVITDHGHFVLFNVYCPNISSDDPKRLRFQSSFLKALQLRVRHLIHRQQREVVIAGDINIVRAEIDHCDPKKWVKDMGVESFDDVQTRRWLNGMLVPEGEFRDACREYHPQRKGMFTVWNTLINARYVVSHVRHPS
jgi:AP endonuclease-2